MAFDAVALSNGIKQVQVVYNDSGQLTTEYQSHDGAVNVLTTPKVQYAYADGSNNSIRQTALVYPNGRELTYDCGTTNGLDDALSRVVSIIDDDSTHLVDYQYLGRGTFVTSTSPEPGIQWTLVGSSDDPDTGDIYTGLDLVGRVKDNRWHKAGTDLDRIKYGYDRASNRIWRENPVAQSHSAEFDKIYTYDGSHRLKDMARGTLNVSHTALTSQTFGETWNLDTTGNWSAYTRDDDGDLTNDLVQARTANEVNEIGTITNSVGSAWAQPAYSPAGNMTTIPQPKDPSKEYLATYDAWNRLVKLEEKVSSVLETVSTYTYDGRKFQIVHEEYTDGILEITKHQYYTDGWQNIEQRNDANTTPAQQYVWGQRYIDDCLLRDRSTDSALDERLYALQDANWNVDAITNPNGTVNHRFIYTPYGEHQLLDANYNITANNTKWTTLFMGREIHMESDLFHFRNRTVSTLIGNFISRDKPEYSLGTSAYALLHPLVSTDPLGEVPIIPIALAGGYLATQCICAYHRNNAISEYGGEYPNSDQLKCLNTATETLQKILDGGFPRFTEYPPHIRTKGGGYSQTYVTYCGALIFMTPSDIDCTECDGFINTIATLYHEDYHGSGSKHPDTYCEEARFLEKEVLPQCKTGIGPCKIAADCEAATRKQLKIAKDACDSGSTDDV
ncbi:MAG: hypothetical protein C0478_09575 [Planctomyces sp.]|nr:hypothetical protein [Planctomyces sp.]